MHIKDEKLLPVYIIGVSILVGAVLVSASVFYNTKIVLNEIKKLTGGIETGELSGGDNKQAKVATRVDAPTMGNKNAKVTLVEFSDFQCPFSKSYFENTFAQIKKKYVDTGKVKLVFRNLPLPFHQNAQKAAEAGECANRQGKFWEYHDLLFKNGQSDGAGLDIASLKKYAGQIGLDTQKFNQCLDGGETASIVKKDLSDAQSAGANGTPTFFINEKQLVGAQPISAFEQAIDEALK